jgi:hypothetical protein
MLFKVLKIDSQLLKIDLQTPLPIFLKLVLEDIARNQFYKNSMDPNIHKNKLKL